MSARPSISRTFATFAALLAVTGVLLLRATDAHAGMIGTGPAPQVIAVGDLNEDGYADLISGNNADSAGVSVSLGRGNGTFEPKVHYSCLTPPTSLAIADLNGDGHLDVAATCPGSFRVRIRFGAGDGTLGPPTDVLLASPPVALVATNFNQQTDAFMDLIVVNHPTGTTVNWLRGTGGGAFSTVAYTSPFRSVHVATGDVDNDGRPDLVFANAADSVTVARGAGTGQFFAPLERYLLQGAPSTVAIADFDQDGNPDIVAAIPGANALNVMLGNGDGTFDPYTSIPAGTSPRWIASGDFNGDNVPDLAVTATGGTTVAVMLGTGAGTFLPNVDYPAGVATVGVAVTQFDVANADLVVAASGQHSICTLPGNGDGTFQVPSGPVYVWGPASGTAFDPNAWLPARGSSSTSDILVFNRGGVVSVSSVPTATIGQLVFSGGTEASFSGFLGAATLTVAGGTGDDAVVERGSKAVLASGGSPVHVNIATGARAEINGDVEIRGGDNKFQAIDPSGIVFQSTGRAIIGPGSSTTPFGNGTGASGLGSVRFLYGSQFIAGAPVSVFGASAPSAVVVLGPGSRYRQTVPFAPDVSGRTYADVEYDTPGFGLTWSGSDPLQVDSLIVTAGTLTSTMTGPVTIRGNIAATSAPTNLMFLPPSAATVRLAGSARQTVRVIGTWNSAEPPVYLSPNVTLNIDNPAGVEFHIGLRTAANLSFTNGNVYTPIVQFHPLIRFNVTLDSTATLTGAGPSTGWVATTLRRRVTTSGAFRLDIGDSISYQPVDLNLHGVTGPGYVRAGTSRFDLPTIGGAQIDMDHRVHRSWILGVSDLSLSSPPTFLSSLDATLSFAPEDVSSGPDPLQFVTRATAGSGWLTTTTGVRTATSIEMLGLSTGVFNGAPGFCVGQPITPSLSVANATEAEGNGPAQGRVQPTQAQAAGSLSFRVRLSQPAIAPVSVDYETVDGSATEADGDYTPVNGTLNFAPGDSALDVVVPFGVDATPEFNETFGLTLSNPTGDVTIETPTATGTILDDDDVTAPTATVLYPNGGELILQNQQVNLTWTATDDFVVSSVDLYLVRGAVQEALAIGHPNTGSYAWNASGAASNKVRFRVVAHDVNHQTIDNSNANWELSASAIGVDDAAPLAFALPAPAPNPAPAGRNQIAFAMPHAANVKLTVHDIQGRTLAKLADGAVPAGRHERTWDATRAAAGVYFVRFEAPGFHAERRLVVIR